MKTFLTRLCILWGPVVFWAMGCGMKARTTDDGASTDSAYSIFLASGYPTAGSAGVISEWTSSGTFLRIIRDYASSGGFFPQSLDLLSVSGIPNLVSLAFNGTAGRVDKMDLDGQNYVVHIDNATAMAAGSRRLAVMDSGAMLMARSAGVEQFNSAGQRVGAAARFAAAGSCIAAAILDADSVEISGVPYVISINAATGAGNLRLQLYNGTSSACISSPTPISGPATTMWPVALDYNASLQKLYVLFYPFTGATSNAQVWSYNVTASAFTTPTLVYSDSSGDIAIVSATPNTVSGDISVYSDAAESFILVGTSFNSVIRLNLNKTAGTATKVAGAPLIYNSVFSRNIASVLIVPNP